MTLDRNQLGDRKTALGTHLHPYVYEQQRFHDFDKGKATSNPEIAHFIQEEKWFLDKKPCRHERTKIEDTW